VRSEADSGDDAVVGLAKEPYDVGLRPRSHPIQDCSLVPKEFLPWRCLRMARHKLRRALAHSRR
jgi:hypothetical protein